jgi:hypothetical protein
MRTAEPFMSGGEFWLMFALAALLAALLWWLRRDLARDHDPVVRDVNRSSQFFDDLGRACGSEPL